MSPDVKDEREAAGDGKPLRRLPRGRHNLPASVVRASQRERLLEAMVELVAEQGYEATTVPQVVARAQVSRNAFYDLFTDKTDCFLALCDDFATEVLDDIANPTEERWLDALRNGTGRYLRWWQERPAFTRTYFVELPSAGRRAVAQRDRQYARFVAMFDGLAAWAREQEPGLPPVSPLASRTIVYAVTELIAAEVRAGRVGRLTKLEADLADLMVLLLTGRPA